MYGLLLRSLQAYFRATFGAVVWGRVLQGAALPPEGFEPMLPYGADVLDRVVAAAAAELGRTPDVIFEDVGTYLVAGSGNQAVRRLLRFGGANFEEFLLSLEELPDRARMALPDLDLPSIRLEELAPGTFNLCFAESYPAYFPVMIGALRAIADDYGALVLIDPERACPGGTGPALMVQILAAEHGRGRKFELAAEGLQDGW